MESGRVSTRLPDSLGIARDDAHAVTVLQKTGTSRHGALALAEPSENLYARTRSSPDFDALLRYSPLFSFGSHLESEAVAVANNNAGRWNDEGGRYSENNTSADIRPGPSRTAWLDVRVDGR